MPLVKSEMTGVESAWGLWEINETEQELAFFAMESCPDDIVAPSKRREYLAGRALVKTLVEKVGAEYTGIRKDEQGKPYLKDQKHEISLSHSSPYVAAQIHVGTPVGIDIEQPKEKLLRVAPRILSNTEEKDAGDNIVKHCVYWCAKEAMYKIYGKRGLHFNNQLNVDPFELKKSGTLTGYIRTDGMPAVVALGYLVKEDYVLVYTKPAP
ncbi:MAG TPA: 4'-phosphopantetheinyl transferase superfamily protein [Cyclobacteriaceae bacterium]|nr:4'-phosphopantetheinyl transferase superfamily protein [Cyclobacteriaceae bacterium]